MTKTVLELNLVGYGTICPSLDQGVDHRTILQLDAQIQGFIDLGLRAVDLSRDQMVMKATGDGAILVFDSSAIAHAFAAAVHGASVTYNAVTLEPRAKRVFRVGMAIGEIATDSKPGGGFEIGGDATERAIRLGAKAIAGGVLIDEATFLDLPPAQKARFSPITTASKPPEALPAYSALMIPSGSKDADYFISQTDPQATSSPLRHQQEELIRLHEQKALANGEQRFAIGKQIATVEAKIREYEEAEATGSAPTVTTTKSAGRMTEQQKRIRDFVEIMRTDLDDFDIVVDPGAIEWRTLEQMRTGPQLCTAENFLIVGRGLWNRASEVMAKGGLHLRENFEIFWAKLLGDLRQRFYRANTNKEWIDLQGVLDHPAEFGEEKWKDFLARWANAPFPNLEPKMVADLGLYRRGLVDRFSEINLSGFGGAGVLSDAQGKADLSKVFVDLNTKADPDPRRTTATINQLQKLSGRIHVLRRLAANPRVVLIGSPGSGKTTILQYFSLCLAQCGITAEPEWRQNLELWPEEETDLIPIFVEVRKFAWSLPAKLPAVGNGQQLMHYILEQLKRQKLKECEGALKKALEIGRAIVFLDGLDEMPNNDKLRRFVLDTVMAFASGPYQASRIVVTCRPRSYDDPFWQLSDFERVDLAELNQKQIGGFIRRFYAEVARRDPKVADVTEERTAKLESALRREELQELAGNPLMLTVMAWLHRFEELPRKRAKILDILIEQLLFKWEERKLRDAAGENREQEIQTLTSLLTPHHLELSALRRLLCRVAFRSRKAGELFNNSPRGSHVDFIPKNDLLQELQALLRARSERDVSEEGRQQWALNVCQIIDQRTGLIIPEGGDAYTMPYKLQEFLAGEYLTDSDELETFGAKHNIRPEERQSHRFAAGLIGKNGYWEEVVKWAGAFQAHVKQHSQNLARDLADELCRKRSELDPIVFLRRAVIAAEILMEMGLTVVVDTHAEKGPACLSLVRETLDRLMLERGLQPSQRSTAGTARGWLGKLPQGIGLDEEGLPDIEWVVIAPGDVLMGDRRIRENGIQPAPSPIDHAFRISRYPVTVAQFQAFVDDGGYEKEYLWSWSVEAQQWFTAKKNNGANRNEKLGPKNFESVFQTPNHPRVGICWFEAMAFCKWLNEKRGWDKDSIRLPSEQEWVRALGGAAYRDLASTNLPAKQCNIFLSLIGHTSAVNLFPEGDTARESGNERGVADLIGNVWEWCCTQWTDHPQNTHDPVINNLDGVVALVARGGSWTFGTFPRNISELRRGYGSGYCDHELGFRLAHGGETAPTRVRTTGTTEDSDASRRHQPRESVSPGSVALPPQDAQLARDLSLSEDDILAITDYWDATNTRRLALIQKKLAGKLSPEERIELADLKRLARAKATLVMPLSPPELEEKNERQQGRAGSA